MISFPKGIAYDKGKTLSFESVSGTKDGRVFEHVWQLLESGEIYVWSASSFVIVRRISIGASLSCCVSLDSYLWLGGSGVAYLYRATTFEEAARISVGDRDVSRIVRLDHEAVCCFSGGSGSVWKIHGSGEVRMPRALCNADTVHVSALQLRR